MWSAKGVASLKESLQQPGVKFQSAKPQEPDSKVYHSGQELAETGPQLPVAAQASSNNGFPALGMGGDEDINTNTTEVTSSKSQKLVLDSGAFITGVNLSSFGPDCEYYTIEEVVAELKDENAKNNFQSFPFPITVKTPSNQSLLYINKMSMQTGDFHVLSLTDRKVLALAHQLELETNGAKYIRESVKKPDQFTDAGLTTSTTTPTSAQLTPAAKSKAKKAKKQPQTAKSTAEKSTETTAAGGSERTDGDVATSAKDTAEPAKPAEPAGWAAEYTVTPFNIDAFLTTPANASVDASTASSTFSTSSSAATKIYPCYPSPFESFVPQQPVLAQPVQKEVKETKKQQKLKFILPGFDDGEWLAPTSLSKLTTNAKTASQLGNARDAVCTSLDAQQFLPVPVVATEPVQINFNNNIPAPNQPQAQNNTTPPVATVASNDDAKPTSISALFQQARNNADGVTGTGKQASCVGAITTDYSMQNVMLQCGLKCLTVDGLAISSIRQYIMGCHACYTLSKDMSRGFCPSCGGFTMVRLIVNVDKSGNTRYNWPMQRILNTRGTIFQIPQKVIKGHKGRGKIVLREDMMPKPKLKDVLIARGEKEATEENSVFDDAALFGYIRAQNTKLSTFGFGKRNMNVARRRK